MLSKNKLKYLRQLALKKHRDEFGVFLAEGPKVVGDLLPYFHCQMLCATTEYLAQHPTLSADEIIEVSQRELEQASQLKTPRDVLAVFSRPEAAHADELLTLSQTQLVLALDGCRTLETLGRLCELPTGLASNTFSVLSIQPTFSHPRRYRPRWERLVA